MDSESKEWLGAGLLSSMLEWAKTRLLTPILKQPTRVLSAWLKLCHGHLLYIRRPIGLGRDQVSLMSLMVRWLVSVFAYDRILQPALLLSMERQSQRSASILSSAGSACR
jgi:hypothetical protein